jgi:hypothetical protein
MLVAVFQFDKSDLPFVSRSSIRDRPSTHRCVEN